MKGKLIVIEGLDGSGKNTQATALYESLKNDGKNVIKVSFPDYSSQSAALINMYLSGQFGEDPDCVNPYAATAFYAVDRYASFQTKWKAHYESGGIVIADRYTTSNAIHQCSKLPEDQWDSYLRWLFEFEYRYIAIPEPDKVIYLRVDPDVSQKLLDKRYDNDAAKKDIHERSTDYLMRSRKAADYCADLLKWTIVECTAAGSMRSKEDIASEVMAAIRKSVD